MASLITVRIDKGSSPNLGFRLQGGKDFGTPLVIQKVNGGSPAERAGLIAGDSVIKINNTDVFNLRHKDAQDVVVRAGHCFDVTVQRGGSTWKPSVVPTASYPTPSPNINNISPITKTSLAAKSGENIGAIGTGHNLSAKPFAPQVNGAVNGGPKVVNKQYNTPIKLYSEESIAETLSAQTEVLPTGALGVNFKKNEKNYDASNSAVLRALKEAESEPKTPDEEPDSGIVTAPNSGIAGLRHVQAPENRPAPANPQLPPGQNICADCERLIVGVFVRIKDKNLHVECFKCSTCGSSLKNVGYYNINNKLYCDIHAKAAAIRANQNPNLVPVTVPPGGKAPVHAISAALSSHSLPSPSPLSPKLNNSFASPYQPQEQKENVIVSSPVVGLAKSNVSEPNNNNLLYSNSTPVSFSKFLNKNSANNSGPRPFSSVSAPLSPHNSLPKAAPLSPSYNTPSYTAPSISPGSSAGRYPATKPAGGLFKGRTLPNIIWPPPQEEPDLPTASPLFYPPPSQVEQKFQKLPEFDQESEYTADCSELEEINNITQYAPNMSFEVYSERRSANECIETISESLETQKLVENILRGRTDIPPPLEVDIKTTDIPKPHTDQKVVSEEKQSTCSMDLKSTSCYPTTESCELKRPTQFTPNTVECKLPSKIENAVPLKWESPLTQALRTTEPDKDTFASIPTKHSHTALASALAIAPQQPFTPASAHIDPVPLPEETVPYLPPERPVLPPKEENPQPKSKPEKPKSQFVKALEVTPEPRCATPVRGVPPPAKPKPKDPMDKFFEDLPKPQQKLSLLSALTTAPDRPYSPLTVEAMQVETKNMEECGKNVSQKFDKSNLTRPKKPDVLPESFAMNKKDPKPPVYYPPNIMYQKTEEVKSEEHTEEKNTSKTTTIEKQTIHNPQVTQIVLDGQQQNIVPSYPPVFQGFSCSFQNKTDRSQFSVEINTTPPIMTPPPKAPTPVVKTIETPGYIEKETVTEEKRERQQTTKKHEQSKEELKTTAKQAEEIITKKANPPVILHKPEGLPQYQVHLEEESEANLKLLEKKQMAQEKMMEQHKKQQKIMSEQKASSQVENIQMTGQQPAKQEIHERVDAVKKPIIKVESDDDQTLQPQRFFKPVIDDRPPSRTFSPRPGTITPSMINKPPSILPYYQANLVAHRMAPPEINLFDPKSPAVSRSPSPCPGMRRERSPSPFHPEEHRKTVSPAPGPPPNPLSSPHPLPTPKDTKIVQARESLTTFIPEYKSKMDLLEQVEASGKFQQTLQQQQQQIQHLQQQSLHQEKQSETQKTGQQTCPIYSSTVQTKNYPIQQQSSTYTGIATQQQVIGSQQQLYDSKLLEKEDKERSERYATQIAGGIMSTEVDEQTRRAHMEQVRKCQNQSVERSADGLTQVQRKKVVTEEYERTQKETNIQIERNITYTKGKQGLVGDGDTPGVLGMHVTNPQPISSPFFKQTTDQKVNGQQSQQIKQQCQLTQQQSQAENVSSSQQLCQKPTGQSQLSANKSNASAASGPIKHVFAPSSIKPVKHVDPPTSSKKSTQNVIKPNVSQPNSGVGGGRQAGGISVAPRRGRGVLNTSGIGGARIPLCGSCNMQIRGPFITALGKIWCPNHFVCTTPSCKRPLQDLGFVEEHGQLYCEYCFERYLAPDCSKCSSKIKGDCLKAIGKNFHPECFNCVYCGKLFGNNPFFLEDGSPYCEADWNELFTTKCYACGFPVEAGDRWVEALNNNYHSQCFNCTMCKKNLEGQSFFAKGGRPFCKNHAR